MFIGSSAKVRLLTRPPACDLQRAFVIITAVQRRSQLPSLPNAQPRLHMLGNRTGMPGVGKYF
jgi:hypothetical protein